MLSSSLYSLGLVLDCNNALLLRMNHKGADSAIWVGVIRMMSRAAFVSVHESGRT